MNMGLKVVAIGRYRQTPCICKSADPLGILNSLPIGEPFGVNERTIRTFKNEMKDDSIVYGKARNKTFTNPKKSYAKARNLREEACVSLQDPSVITKWNSKF